MEKEVSKKIKILSIFIIAIVIVALITITSLLIVQMLNKKDVNATGANQIETLQDNKQIDEKIQINGNVATKNVMLNGKTTEIKMTESNTIKIDERFKEYQVSIKVEIEGKETEKLEKLETWTLEENSLSMKDFVKDVKTIKGEDNKDYIVLILNQLNATSIGSELYYVISENGKILGMFENRLNVTVKLKDYNGVYLQVKDDCIIKYERDFMQEENNDDSVLVLTKWRYTIKDDKLEKVLEKIYDKEVEDESMMTDSTFMQTGEKRI